jgi:hypothetical protein
MSKSSGAPEAGKLIAVVYTWSGQDSGGSVVTTELRRVGTAYSFSPAPPDSVLSNGKLRVNRLVLYPNGATSEPFVTDVIPTHSGQESTIRILDNGKRVEIRFAVRSVFYRREEFELLFKEDSDKHREVVRFEIDLKSSNAGDFETFSSPDLINEKLIPNFKPTLAEVLNSTTPHRLKKHDGQLKIGKTLGTFLEIDDSKRNEFRFSRPEKLDKGEPKDQNFFALEFTADLTNKEQTEAQMLRGFNSSFLTNRYNRGRVKKHEDYADADELIVFDKGKPRPLPFVGHQLVSDELTPGKPLKRRASWLVMLDKVPVVNLATVWNELAKDFHSALRTVRAGNKISFLPTFSLNQCSDLGGLWSVGYFLRDVIDGGNPAYVVEGNQSCDPCKNEKPLENKCTDHDERAKEVKKCAKYTAFSFWPTFIEPTPGNPVPPNEVKICLKFPGVFDEARSNLSAEIKLEPLREAVFRTFQNSPTIRLFLKEPLSFRDSSSVRVGAIDLKLGARKTLSEVGQTFFEIAIQRDFPNGKPFDDERFEIPDPFVQTPTTPTDARRLHIKLRADVSNIADVLPGGQDAPASAEFIDPEVSAEDRSSEFKRTPPIILPWPQNSTSDIGDLSLVINEESDGDHTDSLSIQLRNFRKAEATEDQFQKVVIVDPDPFSIVAVKFPPFNSQGEKQKSSLIGFWVNGPDGAHWQLQSIAEDFSLVLPPQIVGEEMQRHRTIANGNPINFRFSQPTTIKLSQSEFAQNFREPPWNLRRILEPEGAQASGVKITFMQFELLYGLSCEFKTKETNIKNLRLMEIFRRFGRIPGPVPKPDNPNTTGDDDPVEAWRKLFLQYRARIGVFTPWEPSNEQSLILNQGVQCVIRRPIQPLQPDAAHEGANWADPINTEDLGATATAHNYKDLRGGAVWGFESRNVFTAVTRPNPSTGRIESNTARLIDPQFSSLGGWGHVKATFDNNRSAIYGDAAMGRTYSYTLERIGRIACFWNRAKHVIVYERQVAPSRQFVCTQDSKDELTGLPLLRKVKEYIEILEPSRTYPENPLSPAMQRGFVKGCHFSEGQRINVDSLWGSDVGDHGWKVPLWNPSARRDVYPKPVFRLGVEGETAGRDAGGHCQCDNPENVFFYTNTSPKLDADTNAWPAVVDIDYVNLPLPEPAVNEYPDGSLIPVFPNDPPVAPGFTPCTFRVAKPTSPINVVAERAEKAMSTVLQNVSMMRASVRAGLSDVSGSFGVLTNLNRSFANIYSEVFKKLPEAAEERVEDVKARLKNVVAQQQNAINGLRAKLISARDDVQRVISNFENRVIERENQILDTMGKRLTSFIHDLREEYRITLHKLVELNPPNLNDKAVAAVQQMFQKRIDTLFMVPLSSNILRRAIAPYIEGAQKLRDTYRERCLNFKTVVEGLPTITPADRLRLRQLIQEMDPEIQSVITALQTVVESARSRIPEPWMPDPKKYSDEIRAALATLKAYPDRLNELIVQVTSGDKAAILIRIDALLQLGVTALDSTITELNTAFGQVDQIREEIRNKLTAWIAVERDCVAHPDTAYCKVLKAVQDAGADGEKLKATAERLDNLFSDKQVDEQVAAFKQVIKNHEAELRNQAKLYTAHLLSEIQSLIDQCTVNKIQEEIDNLGQTAQDAFAKLSQARQKFLDQANRVFEDNYKGLQELQGQAAKVFQSADDAVRLVRAFGAPPTVPNLAFDRPEVAYFYQEAQRFVNVTPILARVNQAQQGVDALKALGVRLPTKQLFEDLVPQPLQNFDLRKIFPDFSGVKLDNLFPGLKMPSMANDRVRISHGVDAQTRRAWVQAVIDKVKVTTPSTLFAIGPVELGVRQSTFTALTRFEAGVGEAPKRQIKAEILGDWDVKLGGQSLILFKDTSLTFDDAEGLKFHLDPSNIQLNGVLNFISDLLAKFGGKDSGLKLGLLPEGGIQCVLSLPLPPVQAGAFGISNLNLGALLALRLNDRDLGNSFSIELGFNLARKSAPFALTIFFLGGGGYLEVSTRYAPGTGKLKCSVLMGITASASLALSLGPIHGGVYVYFGITAEFEAGGGAKFAIGVMLLLRGEVSLLGIVSASISLLLEVQYDTTSGQLIGHGRLSISIKICWCFTLEINEDVTYTVGEGNGNSASLRPQASSLLAANFAERAEESYRILAAALPLNPTYEMLVQDYVNMLA